MKIKKISIIKLICLFGLLQAPFTNADELFDAANNRNLAQESQLVYKSDQSPSDNVTTEVIDGNNEYKSKSSKNSKIRDVAQNNDAIGEILIQAMSLMGISYKWGGNTPETGMDCSGFIRYVFKKSMGITLPRTADGMSKVGKRVSIDEMQPGDLILFNTLHGRRNSHIGMYIGNNQFIQSPRTGQKIQITEYNNYWRAHTNGIKRIVQETINEDNQVDDVQTFENVRNEALPSGYIKGKYVGKSRRHHLRHTSLPRRTRHAKVHKASRVVKKSVKSLKKKKG
ncbi:MAG: C40 family peptidase [Neisseriaceae bacterium]